MTVTRNELRTELRITGENAVKAGLTGVGRAADSAGDNLGQMGRKADKSGEEMRLAAHDADYLKRKLIELKAAQLALIKQFDQSGDAGLLGDINKGRRQIRQFERLASEMSSLGETAGKGFSMDFAAAIEAGGPIAIAALVGVVAAALPALGAMVAGAVTGAVGAGGVIGGAVAAFQDPQVKAAGSGLLTSLGSSFKSVGEPMAAPMIEALGLIQQAGREIAGDLRHDFDILAPALVPLTKGLLGLVQEMMPGLTAAFQNSLPVIRAMSTELPKIGKAIGDFFQITSEDTQTSTLGFIVLSKVIQNTLVFAGRFVEALGLMYKGGVKNAEMMFDLGRKTTSWLEFTGLAGQKWAGTLDEQHAKYQALLDDMDKAVNSSDEFTQQIFGMGEAADRTAQDIADIDQAIKDLFNVTMDMEQANVQWAAGLRALTTELKNGKRTLSLNSDEGIKNRQALDAQVEVAERFREAQIAMGVPLDQATLKFSQQIEYLRELALKTGFAAKEVDIFFQQWQQLPDAKDIQLNLKAGGDAAAWAAFRTIERHEVKDGTMWPQFEARAGGGRALAGRGYLVGEKGPEFFSPDGSGTISSAAQTAAMMSGASGGSRYSLSDSGKSTGDALKDVLLDALWPDFIHRVRINGGDPSAFGAA